MRMRIRWRQAPPSSDRRLARFRAILLSASRTPWYRGRLESAGLAAPDAIARLKSIDRALDLFPIHDYAGRLAAPDQFRNPLADPPVLSRLFYPMRPTPRAAILMPGFEERSSIRIFPPEDLAGLERFEPETIAAPAPVLLRLARLVDGGELRIPPISHGLVAFIGLREGLLDDEGRDLLWRIFRVPVFEQMVGLDGRLLAWQCQALDNLHLASDNAVFENDGEELLLTSLTDHVHPALRLSTGFHARLTGEDCGCGREGVRLTGLAFPQRPNAVAAYG